MEQYNIRITNTTKIVLALVLTPLTIMPVIFLAATYGPSLPDWAVFSSISALLIIAIALTVFITKKISPKGVVTITDSSFNVDFPDRNMFAPKPFEVKIAQIKNFFAEEKNEQYYMSFTTTTTPRKFNVEAQSKDEEDLASFIT